jgi:hypothetical protein
MNSGKYIFAQLIEFLPQRIFDGIVMKYGGNKYVKHFTCWNQLLVMMFGQLSTRDSLRDLTSTIAAHSNKTYHLGFGKNVTRSNLSKANEVRNPQIFEDFAYHMIDVARKKRINTDFVIDGKVYAFDSSTIDLCLNVFWWARFRHAKAGIKLHTLYDVETDIPAFIHITEAKVHDVNAMDVIPYETSAYYVFDRGYYDLKRHRTFIYITNNFEIPAEQVALLYKYRWQVELFFKWIKQHLKIKSFWGTTESAVRTQIFTAITAYCMVAIVEHDLQLHRSTYEVLRILSASLLDKTPIKELFSKNIPDVVDDGQLTLNFI